MTRTFTPDEIADLDLIAWLEAARRPDRLLDALIECQARRFQAYAVGLNDGQRANWAPVGLKGEVEGGGCRYHSPTYTFSIDAALTLVDATWFWRIGHDGEGQDPAAFCAYVLANFEKFMGYSYIPAIALSIAALKARVSIRASGTRSTGSKPDEAPPNRVNELVGRDDLEGAT